MSSPIFVNVRNDSGKLYDSYTDYYSLIRLSGFPTCEEDQLDRDSDNVYIFPLTNGNTAAAAAVPRKCRFIAHQLERPVHGLEGFAPANFDDVWVSDRWLASQLKDDPRVKYVPIGGHPGLGGERRKEFRWDVTHQCYRYGRRDHQLSCVEMNGYRLGQSCWGAERDEQLASSRVGICLHQDDPPLPIIEPLRMTLFSCWKIPLVAEFSHDYFPYAVHPVEDLPAVLGDGSTGEQNYRRLTEELTFIRCVEEAL